MWYLSRIRTPVLPKSGHMLKSLVHNCNKRFVNVLLMIHKHCQKCLRDPQQPREYPKMCFEYYAQVVNVYIINRHGYSFVYQYYAPVWRNVLNINFLSLAVGLCIPAFRSHVTDDQSRRLNRKASFCCSFRQPGELGRRSLTGSIIRTLIASMTLLPKREVQYVSPRI